MGEYTDKLIAASAIEHVKSYFRKSKSGKRVKVTSYTRDGGQGSYTRSYAAPSGQYVSPRPAAAPKSAPAPVASKPVVAPPKPKPAAVTPKPEAVVPTPKPRPTFTDKNRTDLEGGPPSEKELFALHQYTREYHLEMNDYLRKGKLREFDKHTKKDVELLLGLLDRSSLNEDVTAYRGVYDPADLGDLQVGSVLTDKGFVSFTEDERVANEFAWQIPVDVKYGFKPGRKTGGVIIETKLPKGSKALDRTAIQKAYNPPNARSPQNEREFIRPPTKLRVVSIDDRPGRVMRVVTELVEDQEQEKAAA